MYLCVILDLFNREVLGWHLSENMETSLLVETISKALKIIKPKKGCIFHSD
jgi:putative transposase